MSKTFLLSVLVLFSLQLKLAVAEDEVKADVAFSVQQDGEIWAGQQVTLNLDLKTTGFSFSNTHFNLPEVSGAFLMQIDTTTIKFSENINGENWQIIRYPLALYPQKGGQLDIPPIHVRFSTSAGFGSIEKAFDFQTEPLQLPITAPPGLKQGELIITTTSLKLDYHWQPETGAAKTGDAITLTVTRQANDISAMLLPQIPVFRSEGLAAYPQAPEVKDKTNRGDLTGERTDSIIWVVEKPGKYEIPGIRFQWWDPDSRELKHQIIPGLSLDILPSATDGDTTQATDPSEHTSKHYYWLWLGTFVIMGMFVWLRFTRGSASQKVEDEKSSFETLKKACNNNNARQTYAAVNSWLSWVSPAVTLGEFAQICDDAQLSNELKRLQEELISTNSHWQGNKLLVALQRSRSAIKKKKNSHLSVHLAPLNP